MDLDSPFDGVPVLVHRDGGITNIKAKYSCQEMARKNFISGKGKGNQNHKHKNLH